MPFDIVEEMGAVVRTLDAARVDYALVGAFALAIYGAPRATTDIDILIRPEDVERAFRAVTTVGFNVKAAPMTFANGVSFQRVSKIEREEVLTLDLLLATAPLLEAWNSRIEVEALGMKLRVVSRAQLVRMKALAGRLSDLADIERLDRGNESR